MHGPCFQTFRCRTYQKPWNNYSIKKSYRVFKFVILGLKFPVFSNKIVFPMEADVQ